MQIWSSDAGQLAPRRLPVAPPPGREDGRPHPAAGRAWRGTEPLGLGQRRPGTREAGSLSTRSVWGPAGVGFREAPCLPAEHAAPALPAAAHAPGSSPACSAIGLLPSYRPPSSATPTFLSYHHPPLTRWPIPPGACCVPAIATCHLHVPLTGTSAKQGAAPPFAGGEAGALSCLKGLPAGRGRTSWVSTARAGDRPRGWGTWARRDHGVRLSLPPPPGHAHRRSPPAALVPRAVQGESPQGAHCAPGAQAPLSGEQRVGPTLLRRPEPGTGRGWHRVRPQRPFVSHRLFLFACLPHPPPPRSLTRRMGERLGRVERALAGESRHPRTSPRRASVSPPVKGWVAPAMPHLYWRPW